ncbi:MAG: FkbM family methyltransferase [Bacteroidales bacterium]|nr:FkbM family methyltransferase [Bacteroidales bacterium]
MKEIPLHIKHKYPGSWLFKRKVLNWLFIREYYIQLPFFFRLFSLFIRFYFKLFNYDYCIPGRWMFLIFSFLNLKITRKKYGYISVNNCIICLYLADPRFLNIINELTISNPESDLLFYLLKQGDTFIDIGANHGSYALLASKLVGKKGLVIAVEPQPMLCHAIRMTFMNNNYSSCLLFETALGKTIGEVQLFIPSDTSGTAGIFSSHSATHKYTSINVTLNNFDNLLKDIELPGRIMVKVDIEGSEYDFILGAKDFFLKYRPIMLMEINPHSLAAAQISKDQMRELIKNVGFTCFSELSDPNHCISVDHLNFDGFRNVLLSM